MLFQSTRPVWGATGLPNIKSTQAYVSIHAPRVGRDQEQTQDTAALRAFQSTRPVWGAT